MPPNNNAFGSGPSSEPSTSRLKAFLRSLFATTKGRIIIGTTLVVLLIIGGTAYAYYRMQASQNSTETVNQTDDASSDGGFLGGLFAPKDEDKASTDKETDKKDPKDAKDTKKSSNTSTGTKKGSSGGSTGGTSSGSGGSGGSSGGGTGGGDTGGGDTGGGGTPSNCPGSPNQPDGEDPWGGCWPGPSNTGIAGCPALTTHNGSLTVSSGTTIQNRLIKGQLRISASNASNITIRCVKVEDGGFFPIDTERSGATSASQILLDRVEVDCGGSQNTHGAMLLFGATLRKGRVYNCPDAYRFVDNVVVEDSYCSNLNVNGDDENEWHYDCMQTGGGQNITIRHNSLVGRDTSDIALWPEYEPLNNVLVERNLLLGTPGYKIYVGRNTNPSTNITIKENRFGTGGYGPCTIENASPTWTGNVWNATGLALPVSSC